MPGHLLSNIPLKIKPDQSDVSDHHTVLATFNTNFNDNCKESNTFTRNWKALGNENVLKEAQYFLGEKLKSLRSPMKTIDKQISELHSSLTITLDKFCPMKKVKPSKIKNWIDNEIKKDTTKKKQQRRKMNEINSEENKLAYKKQSNLVKKLGKEKKMDFLSRKITRGK